jgi:hypothetical protein
MIRGTLSEIVNRLQGDWNFVASFLNNREEALAGFDLSKEEKSALLANSPKDFIKLGIDKMKAAAAVSGGHSRTCCTGGSAH